MRTVGTEGQTTVTAKIKEKKSSRRLPYVSYKLHTFDTNNNKTCSISSTILYTVLLSTIDCSLVHNAALETRESIADWKIIQIRSYFHHGKHSFLCIRTLILYLVLYERFFALVQ